MKLKASAVKINNGSIFILRKPTDKKIHSSVSLQMETKIVNYLVRLVNEDQKKKARDTQFNVLNKL